MNKHNSLIDRTYRLEQHMAVVDESMKVANHRIADLEAEVHHYTETHHKEG